MKLWKEGIIEGYSSGKSGIFGTYNNATRAEFIAAVVRAVNQNTIPVITNSPFEDVKPEDWYAGAIEYAKNQGWVSGCNITKTRFCPNDPISRAEAAKILSLAFERVKTKVLTCQTNQTNNFSDVSADAWYSQYACATKAANVISGYPNKTFRPTNSMTRAEMAKAICSAAFGASECIESGDLNRPMILSVSPSTGVVNQPVTLSIEGSHLPQPLKLNLQNCQNIQYVSGGNTEKQQFTCTPTVAGQLQGQVLDNNNTELFKFTLNIQGVTTPNPPPTDTTTPTSCTPTVSSISPLQVTLDEPATFTINGNCLSDETAFILAACVSSNASSIGTLFPIAGGSATQRQFQCTPTYAIGVKKGLVKDKTGGTVLFNFEIDVLAGTPKATEVSPLTAKLNQATIFTVKGSNLTENTAFFISGCINQTTLSGTTTERKFQCTPSYTIGSKSGVVKDKSGGTVLYDFNVTVQ